MSAIRGGEFLGAIGDQLRAGDLDGTDRRRAVVRLFLIDRLKQQPQTPRSGVL